MKAIVLNDFGDVDQLQQQEIPLPELKPDEVLVKVKAIGINPVDAKTRKGKGQAARIKNDHPMILGWDIAGVVEDANNNAAFPAGTEVFGMLNIPGHGKAYAEYVAARAAHLSLNPGNLSLAEAAAVPLASMTAYQALVTHGRVHQGQRVLVQAAAGGVGHFAVQIAKHLGAYTIGTGSAHNREFILSLADEFVDYHEPDWEHRIAKVDFILEAIGGDNIAKSLNALKPGGTIVSLPSGVSETVGEQAASQGKNGVFFMVQSNSHDLQQITELLKSGSLRPYISKRFEFDQIKDAHLEIEKGKTKGKIVVLL